MKLNIKIILVALFLIAFSANATEIIPLKVVEQPNIILRLFSKLWECKWHISCYSQKLGTTVTDISTATKFQDFPALYNANNLSLIN